jgi:hypothetical protein
LADLQAKGVMINWVICGDAGRESSFAICYGVYGATPGARIRVVRRDRVMDSEYKGYCISRKEFDLIEGQCICHSCASGP